MPPASMQSFDRSPMGGFIESPLGARGFLPIGDLFGGASGSTAAGRCFTYDADLDAWSQVSGGGSVANNGVRSLCPFSVDGKLYVCGDFTTAGGSPGNRLCTWDGTTFATVGGDTFNAAINDLVEFDGGMVIVGGFLVSGGAPGDRTVVWDGSTFTQLGGASPPTVPEDCAVFQGSLYVGGTGSDEDRLQRLSGGSWGAIAADISGGSGGIRGLYADDEYLYIGGDFTTINGVSGYGGLARWNGSAFSKMGTGCAPANRWANDFAEWNGAIYVTGNFTSVNGVTCNGIAKWTGATFEALGTGLSGAALPTGNALLEYQGNLVVGGNSTTVNSGSITARLVASWDGSTWSAMGNLGLSNAVNCLALY